MPTPQALGDLSQGSSPQVRWSRVLGHPVLLGWAPGPHTTCFPLPQVLPAHAPCHRGAPVKPSASLSAGKSRGHTGPKALVPPTCPPCEQDPPPLTAHGAAAARQGSAVQRPEMDIPLSRCRRNTRGPSGSMQSRISWIKALLQRETQWQESRKLLL